MFNNIIPFFLITPERIVYQEEIDSVTLPTLDGEITILPHHTALITMLTAGVMKLRRGDEEHFLSCAHGVVKIDKSGVTVLAESAERADELLEEEVEKARAQAEEAMRTKKRDSEEFTQAMALLERETARLRAVRRHRGRGSQLTSGD